MATQLDVHVSDRRRVVLVGVTVVLGLLVAAGLFLPWSPGSVAARMTDRPATPANELLDDHGWSTAGCFLPGAAIDEVPGLFDFRHACIHHGGCYQGLDREGAPAVIARSRCDEMFRRDLEASCADFYGRSTDRRAQECAAAAESYYAVARSFGAPYYAGSGDPS
jgi:Prokaryotic phospholipase A2